MKRRLFAILLILGVLLTNQSVLGVFASAASPSANPDEVFKQTVFELYGDSGELQYAKTPLYNLDLIESGYYYIFEIDGVPGYSMVVGNQDIGYFSEEIYFDAENPVEEGNLPVFLSVGIFLEYDGKDFLDAITNEIVIYGKHYETSGPINYTSEEIYFERRVTTGNNLPAMPAYAVSSYPNSCANVAATNILGYFDRYCTSLIPNFTAYNTSTGKYVPASNEIRDLADYFYFDMKTNVNGGTSYLDFLLAMERYVYGRGYNLNFNYSALLSNGNIDLSALNNMINGNRPTALFFERYNIIKNYYPGTTGDLFVIGTSSTAHVMVAHGYRQMAYYRTEAKSVWSPVWYNPFRYVTVYEEVNFRNDSYLMVSSGLVSALSGYVRIGYNTKINHAVSINIAPY